jgi:general secretion pathway protein G
LLGAGCYSLGDQFGMARDVRIQGDIQSLDQKLKSYEMLNGFYPTTEQGLQALVTMPQTEPKPSRWRNFMEKMQQDPWHRDYVYVQPGVRNPGSYDLYSKGKDGIAGTADDIGNWEDKK